MGETDSDAEDYYEIRKEKLEQLREQGIPAYPYRFERTDSTASAKSKFDPDTVGEIGPTVEIAGRLRQKRTHGGAAFADLVDEAGKIQLYFSPDYLENEKIYDQFTDLWDLGDFIGVEGGLFKTNEGEISIVVREARLLAKGLRPLPEKYHGLQDKELRYRKRYLDLLANPEVRNNFEQRSKFISALRDEFQERGFLEVETPMMQTLAGGAEAEPFVTHHNTLDLDLYLRIAPELFLKRLLVGGFEQVFEINRNFRNEGISTRHNPEFTMLELYWAYTDYREIMKLTEEVLSGTIKQLTGNHETEFAGRQIDWSTPWERRPLVELVQEETGLELNLEMKAENIYDQAVEKGIEPEPKKTAAQQITGIFETAVESNLTAPTFVTEFPAEVSPLAKQHRDKERLAERFELFIGGLEVGNAYTELNDPLKQRQNFEVQADSEEEIDEDFLEALEHGMPPAGGLGLGIDRLVMLLTGAESIRDVILFPLLQPKETEN